MTFLLTPYSNEKNIQRVVHHVDSVVYGKREREKEKNEIKGKGYRRNIGTITEAVLMECEDKSFGCCF